MLRLAFPILLTSIAVAAGPAPAGEAVRAVVSSTLATDGDKIRQYAFDGDEATAFATSGEPGEGAAVALTFDEPVEAASVEVHADGLDGGSLEGSADGEAFERLAGFEGGVAKARPAKRLKAVRVVPAKGSKAPLAVREFAVDSEPPVARFAYPVEVVVGDVDVPELKGWADKAAREIERSYDLINGALAADGYKPPRVVRLALKDGIDVPAYASGNRITASTGWFRSHPGDVGAMVHEAAHVVQRYRGRNNPGWLVEGVADYVRFVLYEPKNIGPLNVEKASYDQSYRVSARFLDYVNRTYDKDFVLKLNAAMRKGEYSDDLFKQSTGKTVEELGAEWKASLQKPAPAAG